MGIEPKRYGKAQAPEGLARRFPSRQAKRRGILLSPGDVEDVGSDHEVPVDWNRLEETVGKAIARVPILEQARVASAWAGCVVTKRTGQLASVSAASKVASSGTASERLTWT